MRCKHPLRGRPPACPPANFTNMNIEQNIANRKRAEDSAASLAALLTEELDTIEDKASFWRRFDELTRPKAAEQPKPEATSELSPNTYIGGETGNDEIDDLLAEIHELAEQVPEVGQGFAESVLETIKGISETVRETGIATDKQIVALENMRDGLRKWVDRV